MHHFSWRILVFCLLGSTEFVSYSRAGCVCSGGTTDQETPQPADESPRDPSEAENWLARPEVDSSLNHLTGLVGIYKAVDPGSGPLLYEIKPAPLAATVARFVSSRVGSALNKGDFLARARDLVVEPCEQLHNQLGEWLSSVADMTINDPDDWFQAERLCKVLVDLDIPSFLDAVYRQYRTRR